MKKLSIERMEKIEGGVKLADCDALMQGMYSAPDEYLMMYWGNLYMKYC